MNAKVNDYGRKKFLTISILFIMFGVMHFISNSRSIDILIRIIAIPITILFYISLRDLEDRVIGVNILITSLIFLPFFILIRSNSLYKLNRILLIIAISTLYLIPLFLVYFYRRVISEVDIENTNYIITATYVIDYAVILIGLRFLHFSRDEFILLLIGFNPIITLMFIYLFTMGITYILREYIQQQEMLYDIMIIIVMSIPVIPMISDILNIITI